MALQSVFFVLGRFGSYLGRFLVLLLVLDLTKTVFSVIENEVQPDIVEIHGYHFHTYFFQNNLQNRNEAISFREEIQFLIQSGRLANCRLNVLNMGPRGPHPIGSFETCCNKSDISLALSWFMQNHGNLSILLHPLTRYEIQDHTTRGMFLGPKIPLDLSTLEPDLMDRIDRCQPIVNSIKHEKISWLNDHEIRKRRLIVSSL